MKRPEYIEDRQATRNFEEGMKTLFKVSRACPPLRRHEKGCPTRRGFRRVEIRSDGIAQLPAALLEKF